MLWGGSQMDLLSKLAPISAVHSSKYPGFSGQRDAIEIAVNRCVHVDVVREVFTGDELCAANRLSTGHDIRFCQRLDASRRKLRQAFFWANRNSEASPRCGG